MIKPLCQIILAGFHLSPSLISPLAPYVLEACVLIVEMPVVTTIARLTKKALGDTGRAWPQAAPSVFLSFHSFQTDCALFDPLPFVCPDHTICPLFRVDIHH